MIDIIGKILSKTARYTHLRISTQHRKNKKNPIYNFNQMRPRLKKVKTYPYPTTMKHIARDPPYTSRPPRPGFQWSPLTFSKLARPINRGSPLSIPCPILPIFNYILLIPPRPTNPHTQFSHPLHHPLHTLYYTYILS